MKSNKTKNLAYAALMCALMIVSTLWLKFSLPFTDIMVTTQVFFVLLCGLLLPPVESLLAIGVYLLLGLIGLPVFSAASGIGAVLTPSFGYLLGFLLGAFGTSVIYRKLKGKKLAALIASLSGMVLIYVVALPYIAILKGVYMAAPVPFGTLMTAYFLAFLPLDVVKAVLAALLIGRLEKALRIAK